MTILGLNFVIIHRKTIFGGLVIFTLARIFNFYQSPLGENTEPNSNSKALY